MSDTELRDETTQWEDAEGTLSRRATLSLVLVALVVGIAGTWLVLRDPLGLFQGETPARTASAAATQPAEADDDTLWTCGMHPNVLQDEPGTCPICHMDLTPLAGGAEADHAHESPEELFTCPMHPEVLSEEPGSCPICGMDLVPVDAGLGDHPRASSAGQPRAGSVDEPTADPAEEILFYRHPHDPTITSPVPAKDGMGMDFVPVRAQVREREQGPVVEVSSSILQTMNVVTGPARRGDLSKEIRTVGTLDFDQARMVSVTTKYSGFVEDVHANYLGQTIRRGDPLFEVYSPALVQTQEELLSAVQHAERMAGAPEDARRRAEALVAAARRRLESWDVGRAQVERIERRGEPQRTLTVRSPATGVIMKRLPALEGMAITPGMDVLHVADLSHLWLQVQVYEDQLRWVEPGSVATITFAGVEGRAFEGRIRFIEPQIDEDTRTATVTIDVPNGDGLLRVGQYARVAFDPVAIEDAVLVPQEAVLRTGERDLVVVALGEGRFAPREVVLGPETDEEVAVLEGLDEGETIVLSGQFLLASESKLREAVLKMVAERRGATP